MTTGPVGFAGHAFSFCRRVSCLWFDQHDEPLDAACLLKPFSGTALIEAVNTALGMR